MPGPGEELLNVIQDQLWGLPDERLLGSWQLHQVRPGDVVGEVLAMGKGTKAESRRCRISVGAWIRGAGVGRRSRPALVVAPPWPRGAQSPAGISQTTGETVHRRSGSAPCSPPWGPASSWAMMAACSEPTVSSTTASSPAHDSHGGSSTPGLARRASTTRHRAAGRPRARGGAVRPGRLDRRAPGAAHRRRPPRTGCRAGGHPRGRRPTTVGRACSWPWWAALTVLGVTQGAAGHVGHAHWAAGARVMGAAAP
jgi:hypothetical protein